jgi:hypothetical protein
MPPLRLYLRGKHARKSDDIAPTAVTVDYRDNLYIASATRVFVFNASGELQRVIGKRGNGAGEFLAITSLRVDTAGRIDVTEAQSLGAHVLTPDVEVIMAFGEHEAGLINLPDRLRQGIHVLPLANTYSSVL